MNRKRYIIEGVVLAFLFLFFVQSGHGAEKISVFVSILPQKFFVQQIGKDRVDVQVMVRPGASPATYEPKPRQMAALSKTNVYFAVGVAFEKVWLKKIAAVNPNMKVVHTDRGIQKIRMVAHHHHDDAGTKHGDGDNHGHENSHRGNNGMDPHIWLSPPLVKIQAETVFRTLKRIDPSHRDLYAINYHRFVRSIDELDASLKEILAGKQGLQFMVFHPSWGYFARAYGIEQVSIEIEGKDPKPAKLKELIEHARESAITVVFVQPQFSDKSARLIAGEIGGRVAVVDPLAENWTANLQEVANQFKEALK